MGPVGAQWVLLNVLRLSRLDQYFDVKFDGESEFDSFQHKKDHVTPYKSKTLYGVTTYGFFL